MAASWVQICNMALIFLGDDRIQALTESNNRARICSERYQTSCDAVLAEHTWALAAHQIQLAASSTAPLWGYTYKYLLPTDCISVRKLVNEGGTEITAWSRIGDYAHTDESVVYLEYTRKITDPTKLDPLLAETVAARLAMEIAYRITKSKAIADKCTLVYKAKLESAKLGDALEDRDKNVAGLTIDTKSSSWLAARK